MTTVTPPIPDFPDSWSLADLQRHLGDVPAERIRLQPAPGMATAGDVVDIDAHEDRLFELIDGTLVEKTVGWYESLVAVLIVTELTIFVRQHDLGKVLGADGMLQVLQGMVRIPDACFISWDRFPAEGLSPQDPAPQVVPDLVVEVLSKSNTPGEMQRKLADYFAAGVKLAWYIDPRERTANAYSSPADVRHVAAGGVLDGGDVLPEFKLSLSELFAEADRGRPKE